MQGQGRDVRVQERIGERQRGVPGNELQRLELERSERGARIDASHGDGTYHHAVANERHPGANGDRHDRLAANRLRVAGWAEVLVYHGNAVADGTPGHPFTGADLSADRARPDSLPSPNQVAAALAVERRDRDEVSRHHPIGPHHELLRQVVRLELQADGARELVEVAKEDRTLRERLSVSPEGDDRRHAVGEGRNEVAIGSV